MGIIRRRRKQILDGLKEIGGYQKLKEEALDRIRRRTGFVRGGGPVAKNTAC